MTWLVDIAQGYGPLCFFTAVALFSGFCWWRVWGLR